jgi:hypothetical protein
VRKSAAKKPGTETKWGPGLCCRRRRVRATICRHRLLLSSYSLSHTYLYGNWRAKFPNILADERIYRRSRGDPAGLAERRWPRPFTETQGDPPGIRPAKFPADWVILSLFGEIALGEFTISRFQTAPNLFAAAFDRCIISAVPVAVETWPDFPKRARLILQSFRVLNLQWIKSVEKRNF